MLSSLSDLMEEAAEGAQATDGLVEGDEERRIEQESSTSSTLRSSPAQLRGVLTTQDALKAAEHGNSDILAAYLHAGGDPMAASRLHHLGWSLLHLATGCALMGGTLAYRTRPEPDCSDGFSNCVALLLAAGGDPNVQSKNGHTPLIGACLSGDAECCRLLLQAGAFAVLPSEAQAIFDAARRLHDSRKSAVLAVLDSPPKRLPRSPVDVRVRLTATEDSPGSVEVRWRRPPEVGDVQRYVVRGFANGEEIQVRRDARAPETSSLKAPNAPPRLSSFPSPLGDGLFALQRDQQHAFAVAGDQQIAATTANCSMSRGIALRQLLGLPVPQTASTLIHGLLGGLSYHFTVSCVVLTEEGEMLESPPSLPSRPVHIPHVDDDDWNTAEIIDKVLSYSAAAGSATPPTAHSKNVVVVVGDGEVLPEDFEFEEEDDGEDSFSFEQEEEQDVVGARESGGSFFSNGPRPIPSSSANTIDRHVVSADPSRPSYSSSSPSEETPPKQQQQQQQQQQSSSAARRVSADLDDDDDDDLMERRASEVIIKTVFEPLRMETTFHGNNVVGAEDRRERHASLRRGSETNDNSSNCLLM